MIDFFSRLDNYLKYKGLNDNKLTIETGISNGLIGKARKRGALSQENISKILYKYPELDANWLLTGKGDMLKKHTPDRENISVVNEPVETYQKSHQKGIPMLPFDAFAGIGDSTVPGVNFDTIEDRYIVPLFDGIKVDFMLPVRGSSMYPKYSSGDVVACRLVTELLFVQWNKVYVIDSVSQGVIMKRLLKGDNDSHIICRSDNEKYGDFNVPMDDIRSIALVVGVIRLE